MLQKNVQIRLPVTYRISSVTKETEKVSTIIFPLSLGALPGQFVMVWLPGGEEIPMSVANDDGAQLSITFFAVGETTEQMQKLKAGDLLGIRGPFGTHYEWKKGETLALVAGGYGAAPMFFAAKNASKDGCSLEVFIGARSSEHLLYQKVFASLPKTVVHVATDDGSEGEKGTNVASLEKHLAGASVDQIFACGPERMLVAVSDLSFRKSVPSQLSLERYMKCGFGLCGNCVADPLGIRLCIDGPVVKNDTCRQITEFGKYHRDCLGKKKTV